MRRAAKGFALAALACFALFTPAAANPAICEESATGPAFPMPQTREEFRTRLAQVGELSAAQADQLAALAMPAIVLPTQRADEASIAIGATKFGGDPDLPPGMEWPKRPPYPDAQDRSEAHRSTAALILARAGVAPDWMSADEARRFLIERGIAERRAKEGALSATDPDVAGQLSRAIFGEETPMTAGQAKERAAPALKRAQAVSAAAPLSFIAQLDLAALSISPTFDRDLPDHGRLLVFFDLMERPEGNVPGASAGWRLLWDETPADSLTRLAPDDIGVQRLKPAVTAACAAITPIAFTDADFGGTGLISDGSDAVQRSAFWAYVNWVNGFGNPLLAGRVNHQLGGRAQALAANMQIQAELASHGLPAKTNADFSAPSAQELAKRAGDWKLVLQVGVDPAIGLDGGALFVLMRKDDLKARRFDKAWLTWQAE